MKMIYVDKDAVLKAGLSQNDCEFQSKLFDEIRNHVFMCSFVDTDYNNLPMWAYYANNHRGYCINYRINCKDIFYKVLYTSSSTPVKSFFLQYGRYCNVPAEGEDFKTMRDLYTYLIMLFLVSKHISWEHENEYRILFPYLEGMDNRIENEMTGLEILDITVGLRCEERYKQKIMQIAKSKTIPCYQIQLDNKNFLVRKLLIGEN